MIKITNTLSIPEQEIEEKFVLSSGPGGQNVNKVATAVQLRFDISQSSTLPDDIKERLRGIAGSNLTSDDVLIIESAESRSQRKNRENARSKLAALIREAMIPPKKRKDTKPSRHAKEKRLNQKQIRAQKKALRRKPKQDDFR